MDDFIIEAIRKLDWSILRKMPSLWTRSYYVESVGHISGDILKSRKENDIDI